MYRIALLVLMTILCGTVLAQDFKIVVNKTGREISLETLAKQLNKYDVVFFGEYHDNADVHAAQSELLKKMYGKNKRLVLSFEMFERDVQNYLDSYLKGTITEADFLANSRPWPNYETDYKPLIEFAKSKGLTCVAANVPRRLAGMAARNGKDFAAALSAEEKTFMALQINAPEGKYKDNFMLTMQDNGMHGSMMNTAMLDNIYYAQCIKDDTMAESILQYHELFPKHKIIHYNGDFHSREFLGTVERCLWRNPSLKAAVLTPQFQSTEMPSPTDMIATYFIIVPDPPVTEDSETEETP